MDIHLLFISAITIAKGIPVTLFLAVSSLLVGIVIATTVYWASKRNIIISSIAKCYVMLFTSTPLVLQLFFIYYGLGFFLTNYNLINDNWLNSILKSPFIYAILAMSLNSGAYSKVIIQSAMDAIPKGQIEAAQAMGLSKWHMYTRIIIPQAFYVALPMCGNEVILLVKATALTSIITAMEISGYMQQVFLSNYSFYEPFFVAACYYLIITYGISVLIKLLEKKSKKWVL